MSQSNQPKTRRITLPSGHELQLRQYDQPQEEDRELSVCPNCRSELVQASAWSQGRDDSVALTLECPNCAWRESGVYERALVEQFEDRLDDGLIALIDDLHRLTQANMASDVDSFVDALDSDLILPEDF
jgi:hypothetical protein